MREALEVVKHFTCLRSCISSHCSVTYEVNARMPKAREAWMENTPDPELVNKVLSIYLDNYRVLSYDSQGGLAAMSPEGSTKAGILLDFPSLDKRSRDAEVGFEQRTFPPGLSRSKH
ncbi:hypothetical protein T265_06449 [Opisthorchis viverrini]|uniref:Uncharacterized protein n=1 Tax=Opisthorchis viverrini TaxID=6198 RepID=A0A074ZKG6_OPIVI|nr:hypothetical protein T265_06449 [Opisthorchis viverrini]KER26252.1 hypothetical protein T265_06449 [Opisthorchis viverrini]